MTATLLVVFCLWQISAPSPTPTGQKGADSQQASRTAHTKPSNPASTPSAPSVQGRAQEQSADQSANENGSAIKSGQNENAVWVVSVPPISVRTGIYDKVAVGCTVALALIGIIGICVGLRTLNAIQRQGLIMVRQSRILQRQAASLERQNHILENSVQVAKDSADAANRNIEIVISKERARIFVTTPQPFDVNHPVKGQFYGVGFNVLFYGPTEAFPFDTGVHADTVQSQNIEPDRFYIPIIGVPPAVPLTTREINSGTMLEVKPEEIEEITQGKRFVRVYGFIRYRDVFDIQRTTTFRYIWHMLGRDQKGFFSGWIKDGVPADNVET